ncbi:MAG: phospho-sugar mutase [Sulfurovum sp. AS07-7]|nr:MAG: phospho-sugar mutase [Sulfurovum sp. AS07-7]
MTQAIFREYDIRGIFGSELDEKSVKNIGLALGLKILKFGGNVAIGYDARTHSTVLRDWLTSGLNMAGCSVFDMGMVATPINYFANYQNPSNIDKTINASIMITGSHNPPEYNGLKITIDKKPFFGEDIYTLGKEIAQNPNLEIKDDFNATKIDTKNEYINYMVEKFAHLRGFDKKIVIDCGNGVAGAAIIDIFDKLNFNYKALFVEPDGNFPNHHPDPSEEKNLADLKAEIKNGYYIGFAYDGDADRIAVLTPNNNIKGDILAIIYAKNIKDPVVIGEVKCSSVMYNEINKVGKAIMYKTGHSNLKVKLKEANANLACEVSGHIFFADRYFGYDDALYATLRTIELLQNGVDFDKEMEMLPKTYSTDEIKIETTDDGKFKIIEKIKTLLTSPPIGFPTIIDIVDVDGVRINFENGWGLIRASNTTPMLVTRFEATSEKDMLSYQDNCQKLIELAKSTI